MFFSIFKYKLLRDFRDVKMVALLIIFPIILMLILGTTTGDYHETGIYGKINVLCYFEEQPTGLNEMVQDKEINEIYSFTDVGNKEDGLNKLKNESYESFVHVFKDDNKTKIDIYTVNEGTFLYGMFDGYAKMTNTYEVAIKNNIYPDMNGVGGIGIERINTHKDMPTGIHYYAVLSIFQVLLFGGVFGIGSMDEDKKINTNLRLKAMPIKHNTKLFAYAAADISAMMVMSVVVIIFSKHVFNANWGGSVLINLLTILIFCIVSEFFGMFLASISKSSFLAIGILFIIFLFWTKYAGAYDKIYSLTPIMYTSPSFHAKNIIFYNIYGGTTQAIINSFLWLISFAIGFVVLTLLSERKNKHANI